ncbi:uncharacterized protein LOC119990414 [Tripterygium wilfordii]|nr:uncharacterized protein LOC119990414 [Tripterygium wilfordii]XP_038692238.1 uncharacterized protein LOC119990414 [Tripterygium wilfordii]XP_038692239.1 uncharacterized protein LOC119990414 [Tripterygium wilfordii]XP_038692240.1 uncharacterized protein LOC119990414 [Tripterygium wilfordii]XP_038692241.1 uncharacterized protein LOC119990414 [Tripterygium wilfordii]
MAAELQSVEGSIDAETAATVTETADTITTAIVDAQTENPGQIPAPPKRQRRPSVRLGEIGDQPATLSYDTQMRSANRYRHPSWRLPRESSKSSKARSVTNLVNGNNNNDTHSHNYDQEPEENNQNGDLTLEFGHRTAKAKRGTTKRVRSNWISSRVDEAEGNSREVGDEEFRDFAPDSEDPLKDPSPVHSADNVALDMWQSVPRRPSRTRVSESREKDAVEMDNLLETDSRDQKCGNSEGVRTWLIELGLSRYAPVFEIHEVDDEVLPLLTLEDLKDMGINAVGSRRKIYTAIQKLRKGFS